MSTERSFKDVFEQGVIKLAAVIEDAPERDPNDTTEKIIALIRYPLEKLLLRQREQVCEESSDSDSDRAFFSGYLQRLDGPYQLRGDDIGFLAVSTELLSVCLDKFTKNPALVSIILNLIREGAKFYNQELKTPLPDEELGTVVEELVVGIKKNLETYLERCEEATTTIKTTDSADQKAQQADGAWGSAVRE